MRNTELMVGAFYNPHLGRELAVATGIDHLAMADPPAASDPWWPAISERYTLLLHDYLGQLSEPLDERSIQRARALAELYRSPWVAEHFQCLHTEDGSYNLNYVFPPLYTEEFLARFIRNACALQARLDQPLVMENIPGFFDVKASQMPEPMWLRRFFGGPWIAPVEPSEEMLAFAAHAVSRCPRAKAVTFDAFAPSLTTDVLFRTVERIRGAL